MGYVPSGDDNAYPGTVPLHLLQVWQADPVEE